MPAEGELRDFRGPGSLEREPTQEVRLDHSPAEFTKLMAMMSKLSCSDAWVLFGVACDLK